MTAARRFPILLLAWGVLAAFASARAAETPSVDDVVRMLEAGVSEQVVEAWLDEAPALAGPPSPDQLIALQRAGASDELMKRLIQRGQVVTAPGAGEEHPSVGGSADSAAARSSEPLATDGVLVHFRLVYQPRFELDEEAWDLLVYLDGKPLSFVPVASAPGRGEALEFRRLLAPGRHQLRVLQERHQQRRSGRWRHAARVAPESFEFELAPDPSAEVELEFRQGVASMFHGDGPLSFRAVQGVAAASRDDVGGDPEAWPVLCGETGSDGGGDSADCRSWPDLWPGIDVPPREEVLAALRAFDFRPVPKGS